MRKLIVTLPPNRDVEGTVHLEEDCAAEEPLSRLRTSRCLAAQRHGNPTRNPLLPFGDTPLGFYRVLERSPPVLEPPCPENSLAPITSWSCSP